MNKEIITVEDKSINEKCLIYRHKSGLTVCYAPKKLSVTYVSLTVKFGALCQNVKFDDSDSYENLPDGVAHFMEHKIFARPDGSDALNELACFGANGNAYTTENSTSYIFYCSENFEKNLEILLDFVFNPYFTEENVKNECGIIAEEIKMYEDNPSSKIYYNLLSAIYKNHGIVKNICGSCESISKITPSLLYKIHGAFYKPSNMCLVISGDESFDSIINIVENSLNGYKQSPVPEVKYFDEPLEINKRYIEDMCDVSEASYIFGFKLAPILSARECEKRSIAYDILEELLFGKASDFYNSLYERKLISQPITLGFDFGNGYAFSSVSFSSVFAKETEAEIRAFIDKISGFSISESDFLRVKKFILANFVRDFDSTEAIAENLVTDMVTGSNIFDCTQIIEEIDIDYLYNVLKNDFKTDKMAVSAIFPKGEK